MENKKEKEFLFAQRPLEDIFFSRIGPWPDIRTGEAAARRIPAPAAAGGKGESGEEHEGGESNLGMASVGRGTAEGGGSAEQERRRRRLAAAAAVRWPGAAASGSGSTSRGQGSLLRGPFGTGKGGGVSSTVS